MIRGNGRPYRITRKGEKGIDASGRRFVNELFQDCEISRSRGAEFIHCHMRGSRFTSQDVRDFIGMTFTFNCDSFEDLELPPAAFDAFIKLLSITAGNDEKRAKLRELIDPDRLRIYDKIFPSLE